jgi:hypothetical protein
VCANARGALGATGQRGALGAARVGRCATTDTARASPPLAPQIYKDFVTGEEYFS